MYILFLILSYSIITLSNKIIFEQGDNYCPAEDDKNSNCVLIRPCFCIGLFLYAKNKEDDEKMSKVTDLRREVKRRLTESGVADLGGYKLKAIDFSKKQSTQLANTMTKIGKGVINSLGEEITEEEMVHKLNEMFKDKPLSLNIEITEDGWIKDLVRSLNRGPIKETSIRATLVMGDKEQVCYSSLGYKPTLAKQNIWKFNSPLAFSKYGHMNFIDFERLVGTTHFFNSLREYIDKNENMAKVTLAKLIDERGTYKTPEQFAKIQDYLKAEGYKPTAYLRGYQDTKYLRYLSWEDPTDYFSTMDDLFYYGISTGVYNVSNFDNNNIVSVFYNLLYSLNKEAENDVKLDMSNASDYARSYQTKKNIPEKVKKKMVNNKFNKHFGYVEFDELVDLDKIKLIESEWEEINKEILFPINKDHSLRFRRLGKHKAAGLYFPAAKAVCVDIQEPSSMIHEVLHMIDYTSLHNANLSSSYEFRSIVERYKVITDKRVDKLSDEDGFKKRWNGSTKYNKDYYQSTREIFARCGEMYIEKVLGIDSSLVKSDSRVLYPSDDDFLVELCSKYYKKIIQDAPQERIEETKAAGSPSTKKEKLIDLKEVKQISLFEM